jgi:carboxymethylenebutenolidase
MDAYGLRPRIEQMAARSPSAVRRAGAERLLPCRAQRPSCCRSGHEPGGRPRRVLPGRPPADERAQPSAWRPTATPTSTRSRGGRRAVRDHRATAWAPDWGFRIAASPSRPVAALAGFHGGGLVTDDPQSPHRSAGTCRAEVYSSTPTKDPSNAPSRSPRSRRHSRRRSQLPSEVYAGPPTATRWPNNAGLLTSAGCERHFAALFDLLDRVARPADPRSELRVLRPCARRGAPRGRPSACPHRAGKAWYGAYERIGCRHRVGVVDAPFSRAKAMKLGFSRRPVLELGSDLPSPVLEPLRRVVEHLVSSGICLRLLGREGEPEVERELRPVRSRRRGTASPSAPCRR